MKTIVMPKKERLYRLKCSNRACEAVMECKKEELHYVGGRIEDAYVLVCPHCKRTTRFEDIERYEHGT